MYAKNPQNSGEMKTDVFFELLKKKAEKICHTHLLALYSHQI